MNGYDVCLILSMIWFSSAYITDTIKKGSGTLGIGLGYFFLLLGLFLLKRKIKGKK